MHVLEQPEETGVCGENPRRKPSSCEATVLTTTPARSPSLELFLIIYFVMANLFDKKRIQNSSTFTSGLRPSDAASAVQSSTQNQPGPPTPSVHFQGLQTAHQHLHNQMSLTVRSWPNTHSISHLSQHATVTYSSLTDTNQTSQMASKWLELPPYQPNSLTCPSWFTECRG